MLSSLKGKNKLKITVKKHKSIVLFLLKFFITYFIFFAIYSSYLQETQQKKENFVCSPITERVAQQTVYLLSFLGYSAYYIQHTEELSMKIFIEDRYVSRVIEGCNSFSILILFSAFIVAFSGPLKATILYVIFGGFVIYFINIIRVASLTVLLYQYPNQQVFLHNLVFPAIIYGATFFLWVLWVQQFSNYKKR